MRLNASIRNKEEVYKYGMCVHVCAHCSDVCVSVDTYVEGTYCIAPRHKPGRTANVLLWLLDAIQFICVRIY